MIFYDFEVFENDWLAVFIDVTRKKEHVIINSPDKLKALYEANRKDIWVGFNNRHYDQYIMAKIYASLIIKGVKTLDDVPDRLKETVKAILEGDN